MTTTKAMTDETRSLTRKDIEQWRDSGVIAAHFKECGLSLAIMREICDMALHSEGREWSEVSDEDVYAMGRYTGVAGDRVGAMLAIFKHSGCKVMRPAAPPAPNRDAEIVRLREEIEALTHEGRQGELEQANASLADESERLREGLRWYADGHHYDLPNWEDCSGESQNWLFPPLETTEECWMVDDGGIARSILYHGHRINPNHTDDDNITIAPDAALPAAKGQTNPYETMVTGNHSIGIFKDGKLLAANADVYKAPSGREEPVRLEPQYFELSVSGWRVKEWMDYADAFAAELERVKVERDELRVRVSNQESMLNGKHEYVGQDFQFRIKHLTERATTAEADAKHVRQANENYRRENELAVATLEKAREAALQDAADFLSDALNRLYHSAGEKVVYIRDVAAAGHEFVKGIRALKDAPIARSRDE